MDVHTLALAGNPHPCANVCRTLALLWCGQYHLLKTGTMAWCPFDRAGHAVVYHGDGHCLVHTRGPFLLHRDRRFALVCMVHHRFRFSGRDDPALHQSVMEMNLIQKTLDIQSSVFCCEEMKV